MKTRIFIFLFFCLLSFSGCTKRIYFHIQQTLDNGVIACKGPSCEPIIEVITISNNIFVPTTGNTNIKLFEPLIVFIENNNNIDSFYYGLDFSIPVDDIKQEGTYKYKTTDGKNKTIPIIKLLKTNKIQEENHRLGRYPFDRKKKLYPSIVSGIKYENYKSIIQNEEDKDEKKNNNDNISLLIN